MRFLVDEWLMVSAVVLAFSGCGIVESRYQSAPSGMVPVTVFPDAGVKSASSVQPAVGDGVDPATETRTGNDFNRHALSLNVYGFSYHPDRGTVHRLGLDSEVNPGLGLHYELDDTARDLTFVEVGTYYDSGRHWAQFASMGYQFKLGGHWRVGGALALFNSQTYNDGAAFIGLIPLLTYDFGRFKLNAVYFPKFGHYNEIAVFGFYLGMPFRQ